MRDWKKFFKRMKVRIESLKYEDDDLSEDFKRLTLSQEDQYPKEPTRFELCLLEEKEDEKIQTYR